MGTSNESTNQRAVMPSHRGVKAGMVHTWVVDKTVGSPCYTGAISEHFRYVACDVIADVVDINMKTCPLTSDDTACAVS